MSDNGKPKQGFVKLGGKQYLQVNARVQWFRDDHPHGVITTEVVSWDPLGVKASIYDNEGSLLAVDHGSAVTKPNTVWAGRELEKACTAAIGRALALAGYGTLNALKEDVEDNHLSDSPVEPPTPQGDRVASSHDKERLNGGDTPRRVGGLAANDDLTNREVAEAFFANTRAKGIADADVLAVLGVDKISQWTAGRRAAGERVQAWQVGKLSDDDGVTRHDQQRVFEGVQHLFDEPTNAGKWKHCANTYNKLVREGVIRAAMSNELVIAKITAYKAGAPVEDLAAVEDI